MRIFSKSISVAIALFANFSSQQTFAQEMLNIAQINKGVLAAANNYAKAISCVEKPASPETIFALNPLRSMDDFLDAEYVVFWYGHMSCSMGSGTYAPHHAIVKIGQGSQFYVDPTRSSPSVEGLQSRFIEKFVGNSKNTVVVDQLEHNDKDANNFPTLKYRVTYRIDERSGDWRVIEKKQMPYTPKN